MTRISHKRRTEFLLLAAVLFTGLCGLGLTFWGKRATTPYPHDAVNVNTTTATQFAQVLSISPSAGQALVLERNARHGFAAIYELHHARTLRGTPTTPIDERYVVRTATDVSRGFGGGIALFLAAFFAAHFLLRRTVPQADPFILPLIALLAELGLMIVYTVKDPYRETFVFSRQVWGIALWGLIALCVPLTPLFGRLKLRRYQYAYAILAVALMFLLLAAGHGPGGIHISVFGFEPVEIIKVLLIFFVVSYLAERRGTLGDPHSAVPRMRDFAPLTLVYVFTLLLFALDRDLGPAVLLFGAFLTLLFLTTQKWIYPVVGSLLLFAAAVLGYHLHFGFFATRVDMWRNPWANTDPRGAQLAQGLWAMSTGGMWGSGLGLGHPGYMPRAGSDLIFASLGEELGLVGTLCTLIVYCLLIARGFRIALHAVTEFDRLLAAGLTVLLGLQTMIIVGGVTGLVPLTGITLPFVSFGASSLVADFFSVGVLLSLSGKTLPPGQADRATPEWTRAARVVVLGCGIYLLFGIGVFRLFDFQGIRDIFTATRPLRTPDADQVSAGKLMAGQTLRLHFNPRLLAYAESIPRGRILDHNGIVLASDAPADMANATRLLTPDGRPRLYSHGSEFAHLLAAVEESWTSQNVLGHDESLRGFNSYADLLPLYRRQHLPFAPHPRGSDVTLTLDAALQHSAMDALRRSAHAVRDRHTGHPKSKGAAVLLDAATGDVLAAVSLPTFDPTALTAEEWTVLKSGQDQQDTLLYRAVSGLYPPGSAFKIVTAAAALQHGLDNAEVTCRHNETNIAWRFQHKSFARRHLTDEEGFVPHGQTNMAKALRVSCNIYFAHLGIDLGAEALDITARRQFSLSHLPSLAKIGEDLPDCAYGQGAITVSPLEMARVAQAIANHGTMMPPRFIKTLGSPAQPIQAVTAPQAEHLAAMLSGVTAPGGTAQGIFTGLQGGAAGKTGSAQNNQGDGMTHSWFVGFAPVSEPTYAFACIVENGGAGRAAAAPVCRDILRAAGAR